MTSIIIPGEGQHAQVARELLALAESPYHVQTNTDAGLAFVVPEYLAEAYSRVLDQDTNEPTQPDAAPVPKRHRRARKEVS